MDLYFSYAAPLDGKTRFFNEKLIFLKIGALYICNFQLVLIVIFLWPRVSEPKWKNRLVISSKLLNIFPAIMNPFGLGLRIIGGNKKRNSFNSGTPQQGSQLYKKIPDQRPFWVHYKSYIHIGCNQSQQDSKKYGQSIDYKLYMDSKKNKMNKESS